MVSQDKLRELTRCALFTAIALTIFLLESRIPLPIAIPGAKLGLANCVTLYVGYSMGLAQAGKVLLCRIFMGALFSGQVLTLLYSATGGFFCWVLLCVLKKFFSWRQLWFVSPCCGMAHNLGQVLMASFVMGTKEIFSFLPYLLLLSLISGSFVGIATQELMKRQVSWEEKR